MGEKPKHAPKSKKLKDSTITVIDSDGNEIKKSVLIDDKGNIIDERDVDYIEESYIDEFGNKATKQIAKIKDESFNNMLKDELKEQKRYSTVEEKPKHAPKSKKLKDSTITVIDSDGNEIKKSVLIDDKG